VSMDETERKGCGGNWAAEHDKGASRWSETILPAVGGGESVSRLASSSNQQSVVWRMGEAEVVVSMDETEKWNWADTTRGCCDGDRAEPSQQSGMGPDSHSPSAVPRRRGCAPFQVSGLGGVVFTIRGPKLLDTPGITAIRD
jgi:hypothetical protein